MDSLLPLAAGEPFYAFAESRCCPRVGVGDNSCRDAIQKSERVELVEKSLGSRHRRGWRVSKLVQSSYRERIKLHRGENPGDQTDGVCLIGRKYAAGGHQIESLFLPHRAP